MAPKEPGKVVDIRQVLAEDKKASDPYTREQFGQIKRKNAGLTAAQLKAKIASLTTPEALAKGVNPRRIAALQGVLMNKVGAGISPADQARFQQARELRAAGKQVPAELQAVLKALKSERASRYMKTGNDYLQTGYKKAAVENNASQAAADAPSAVAAGVKSAVNRRAVANDLGAVEAQKGIKQASSRRKMILSRLQQELRPMGQLRPKPNRLGRPLTSNRPPRPRPFPNPGPFKPTPR